jgi:hypothetical protein
MANEETNSKPAGSAPSPVQPAVAAPAAPVKLNNSETAAQYECTYTINNRVHVPGVWSGLISDVPPNVAAIMIKQGHKAFKQKVAK